MIAQPAVGRADQKHTYFDLRLGRLLTPNDGVPLSAWAERHPDAPFAVHPDGFLVFLPPDQICASDEYAGGDPYYVEGNLESPFQRRRFEMTGELMREALDDRPAGARVLDVGCGEGHLTESLRKSHPGIEFVGLDYSLHAVQKAHESYPEIDFLVGDAFEPPFPAAYFDVALCNNIWEHVPDPLRLLQALDRVLRPGGRLIISTPSRYRVDNLLRVLAGFPVSFVSGYHVTEYSVGQVQEQLRWAKYRVVRVTSRPDPADRYSNRNPKGMVKNLIALALRAYFRMRKDAHTLESTVFYLAQKQGGHGGGC